MKVRRSPQNVLKVPNASAGYAAPEDEESKDFELMSNQLQKLAKIGQLEKAIPAPRKKKCPTVPVSSLPYKQERQGFDNEVAVLDYG